PGVGVFVGLVDTLRQVLGTPSANSSTNFQPFSSVQESNFLVTHRPSVYESTLYGQRTEDWDSDINMNTMTDLLSITARESLDWDAVDWMVTVTTVQL
ncbi:MAG: hypothetical protein L0215_25035, partial [Gemmataceae bacterium]|nr:hypothetical protein [Gemmataceae bacterium]